MNENINLCELLKGHEGETFYSPVCGNVTLASIQTSICFSIITEPLTPPSFYVYFTPEGKLTSNNDAECVIFPSKDQRDWDKWAEEQIPKAPMTWEEYSTFSDYLCSIEMLENTANKCKIELVVLALLKIHELIEAEYGGNITNEEWDDEKLEKFIIVPAKEGFNIDRRFKRRAFRHIAFHTRAQAEEFLSYPENISLLKDCFMLIKTH